MTRSAIRLVVLVAVVSLLGQLETARAVMIWTGNLDPADPTTWTTSTHGSVGKGADGTLTVDGDSDLRSLVGHIGYSPGVVGQVTVAGAGSTWYTSNWLYVGYRGNGSLSVTSGAVVGDEYGVVGSQPGSTGTVTVSGAGSTWNHSDWLSVGSSGSGTLSILDGGSVVTAGTTSVGADASPTSTIAFGPGGGTLTTRSLYVSPGQLTGTGTIHARGLLSDMDVVFDLLHGASQTITIDSEQGQNIALKLDMSVPSSAGDLGAGYAGKGSLTIRDGVQLQSDYGHIGYQAGSTGTATISGNGSTWRNVNRLYVGESGKGTLAITEGGAVSSNSEGYVGYAAGSTGTVTVSGAGSTWTSQLGLFIGHIGSGTLAITEGGAVSSDDGYLGSYSGSTGTVTVRGEGSTWTSSGALRIGKEGRGALHITDGGEVDSRYGGILGYSAGSTGTLEVSGPGSTWTDSGGLSVGYHGGGALTITGGGLVRVGGPLTIDYNGDGDSFVNMASGGMLALLGDADESLSDFQSLIKGTDAIRYWDVARGEWAPLTGAAPGIDFTLAYIDAAGSDLCGYTLLTVTAVPEPGSATLLVTVAVTALARRRQGKA